MRIMDGQPPIPTCHEPVTLRAGVSRREPAPTQRLCKHEVTGSPRARKVSLRSAAIPVGSTFGGVTLTFSPRLHPCYVSCAPHDVMSRLGFGHFAICEAHTSDSQVGLRRGFVIVWLAASAVNQELDR